MYPIFGEATHEKKLEALEEKAPDALEVAEEAHEERKEKKSKEVILHYILFISKTYLYSLFH